MNKNQLIELSIIVVAIIMVFKAAESLIAVIVAGMYGFYYTYEANSVLIISNLVVLILYLLTFFVLIKYRFRIVSYISRDHGDTSVNDKQIIDISQQQLLYVALVVLTLASLISSIAAIINYVVGLFSRDTSGEHPPLTRDYGNFKANCIKAVIAAVILYYSKSLSEFFTRKNTKLPELEFEKEKSS